MCACVFFPSTMRVSMTKRYLSNGNVAQDDRNVFEMFGQRSAVSMTYTVYPITHDRSQSTTTIRVLNFYGVSIFRKGCQFMNYNLLLYCYMHADMPSTFTVPTGFCFYFPPKNYGI